MTSPWTAWLPGCLLWIPRAASLSLASNRSNGDCKSLDPQRAVEVRLGRNSTLPNIDFFIYLLLSYLKFAIVRVLIYLFGNITLLRPN